MLGSRNLMSRQLSLFARSCGLALVVTVVASVFLPFYMALAMGSYAMMCAGLMLRSERQIHIRLMAAAIALDVGLVLTLEIQRSAVETVMRLGLTPWQMVHVSSSLAAVLLYGPVAYLGWRRALNLASPQQRKLHYDLGRITFALRTVGFLFMFSMLKAIK